MAAPMNCLKISKYFRYFNRVYQYEKLLLTRYSTGLNGNLLDLKDRGLFNQILPDNGYSELYNKLEKPQCMYCGFDPTADSLHIGNLLAILGLIHSQRYGHQAIALIGGATARVGDPSGKTKDRDVLNLHDAEKNIVKLTENLHRIFDNHKTYFPHENDQPLKDIRIINNISWYQDKNIIDFISDIARKFRMGTMLGRHSVKIRLDNKDGMNFAEFTYPIFQAYDWLQLHKQYNCTIQIGGSDQIGNIKAGFDYIIKQVNDRFFGLTIPLLTTSDGHKFGKTEGNAIWLDPMKTPPYNLYQYFLNVADADAEKYIKLFTFLPEKYICNIMEQQNKEPHKRIAQKVLGENVTLLVHGESGVQSAKKWTDVLFQGSSDKIAMLTEEDIQQAPSSLVTQLPITQKSNIKDLCKCVWFGVEGALDKMLKSGSIQINYSKQYENKQLEYEHILPNNLTHIKIGKKSHYLIQWV